MEIWISLLREAMLAKIKKPDIVLRSYPALSGYSSIKLKEMLKNLERINFLLSSTNINPRLALENLMLQI